jgi:hypothetical protein
MKVEYHGAFNVGTEVVWIFQLLGELGFPVQISISIYCDNQSAIQAADNLVAHNKMNHIELDVHYLRKLVQEKVVTLVYCINDDQIVDILAKLLF